MVSYSGETPILSRVIQALKMDVIPIIAITNIGENTVSRNADVVLRICTRENFIQRLQHFLLMFLLSIF
ncbi:SIS domain-containing protein [Coprobacillaceae bacterium CR2/5/TPMF4]|nr:SIS domain-containing protein [Coprobacillaceae bacterium CR2/5/TPMF4]